MLLGEFGHAEDWIDTSHAQARPVMGCSATSLASCYEYRVVVAGARNHFQANRQSVTFSFEVQA